MTTPTADRLVYSLDEAAEALGLSKATIERLVARDELPSLKLGARRVIPAGALAREIERRTG